MTLVVLIALAIGALVGVPTVRRSYLAALRNTLVAQVDGIVATQSLRLSVTRDDVQRLARSSRLVAAIESSDATALSKTAEDELRFALARGGEDSTFVFVQRDGGVVGARAESAVINDEVARGLAPHLANVTQSSSLYLALGESLFEVIVSPVVDPVDDEQLCILALALSYSAPAPVVLEDGTLLQVGLRIGSRLYGTLLDTAARTSVESALSGMSDGSEVEFESAGESQIAYVRTIVQSPATQFVAITSLAPLAVAESALVSRMGVAAAISLGIGLVITMYLARTLSRPVADMTVAAQAIQGGDYTVRGAVRDSGDLGMLARSFNEMGEGLALRDHYRRVLDVVADPEVAKELLAGKIDLGGRSQEVGILFCDIRGFTPLTERMEPPQVIELLNHHMSLLTKVAYEHGGVVDKFVGDLIMVTFGTPKSAPDDAARMARCALAMIAAREEANRVMMPPIEVGIGCAFGMVVAGCMGSTQRLDYTVLGARVNLAARLCSKAPAMRVYVDDETRLRSQGAASVALEPFELRGFSVPIHAHELQRTGSPT